VPGQAGRDRWGSAPPGGAGVGRAACTGQPADALTGSSAR